MYEWLVEEHWSKIRELMIKNWNMLKKQKEIGERNLEWALEEEQDKRTILEE